MRRPMKRLRLLTEGALIVASILMAFALNASWETYQARQEESAVLVRLQSEASANDTQLQQVCQRHERKRRATAALASASGPSAFPRLEADSVYRLLDWAASYDSYDPQDGVVQSLVASGRLGIIRSDSLQIALASWNAAIADLQKGEDAAWQYLDAHMDPFLRRFVDWRTMVGSVEDSSAFPLLLEELFRSREFSNLMEVKRLYEEMNVRECREVSLLLATMRRLISQELERRR